MIITRKKSAFGAATILMALSVGCGREESNQSTPGQIVGPNRLEPIDDTKGTSVYDMGRGVARASLGNGGLCTAFRVGRDLFLTNHHCYAAGVCAQTSFTLGYERDTPASARTTFTCKNVVAQDQALDYALYEVNGATGAADTWPVMKLARRVPAVGTALLVPGYPAGSPFKRVDRSEDCKVTLVRGTVGATGIGYGCDTDGGSSGSPVIDRSTGEVVALHYGYRNGSNAANQMGSILDDVRVKASAAHARMSVVP